MKKIFIFVLITFSSYFIAQSQNYTISTIAGTGAPGFYGDGGPATAAELNQTWGVAVDKAGNVYVADYNNSRIREITTSGIISTIAGINTNGFSGDGGPATAAELDFPTGVAADTSGNVYIADQHNNRVRMVNASGVISTFAGNGAAGFSGDGGASTAAEINVAAGVATDKAGNVYIADFYNFRVRKVTTAGKISTVAGNGNYAFSGDGGPATAASIKSFIGVAVDLSGNIYIADQANGRIRKVNTGGIISTFAGDGTQNYSGDGGPATAAELNYPYGAGTDAFGNVYIADYANERIRLVQSSNIISTIAGDGTNSYYGDGGPATAAEISAISGVAIDASGNVYIADQTNNVIRKLTPVVTDAVQSINDNEILSIYPNPGNGKFTVDIVNGKLAQANYKIQIYNVAGEQVDSLPFTLRSLQFPLDLGKQPNGVYFYKVVGEDNTIIKSGKIVIQK